MTHLPVIVHTLVIRLLCLFFNNDEPMRKPGGNKQNPNWNAKRRESESLRGVFEKLMLRTLQPFSDSRVADRSDRNAFRETERILDKIWKKSYLLRRNQSLHIKNITNPSGIKVQTPVTQNWYHFTALTEASINNIQLELGIRPEVKI